MRNRGRLVVRAVPGASQTLHGFVLRLVEANGHPDPAWIRRLAALPRTFASRRCDLAGLEASLGGAVPASALAAIARWPGSDGRIDLAGVRVSPGLLDLAKARVCPACLAEGAGVRPAWDCRVLVACGRHGSALVDRCPGCGRTLTWERRSVARCVCGADLSKAPVDPAKPDALGLSMALEALLDERSPGHGKATRLPTATFDAAAQLAWFLGTAADAGADWRSRFIARPDVSVVATVIERASAVMLDWPAGLGPWLDGVQARHGEEGLRRTLHRMRYALHADGHRGFLDQARNHLATMPAAPTKGWAASRTTELTWLGATAAASRIGTTGAKVAAMVEAGSLAGYVRQAGRRRAFRVCAASVARNSARYAAALSPNQAAVRLGVSRRALEELRREGLLASVRPPSWTGSFQAYMPDDIDGLLARIAAAAKPGWPQGITPLDRVGRSRHRKLSEVIRGVLDGAYPVHRSSGSGRRCSLADLGIPLNEVWGTRLSRDGSASLDVRRTARALGLSTRMVPVLVQAGCLRAARGAGRRRLARNSVDAHSISTFARRYVLARTLAQRHSTSTAAVGRMLARAGVQPVVRSDTARGISAVWRAADLAALPDSGSGMR